MISAELLALLRCPETQQPLGVASADLLAKLEAERAAGRLLDRAGKQVAERVGEALMREDGALVFPVRDGIPILIVGEAIRC